MQKDLGILSVQNDDGVFLCNDGTYKKIYMFRPASLGNKRVAFIKSLTDRFKNRIRFTSCVRNLGSSVSSHMFMTVSFSAASYYEAKKEIFEFETLLFKDICVFLKISLTACTVDNVLSCINLMHSGEIREFPSDFLFKKGTVSLFSSLSDMKNGFFTSGKYKGVSFIGKNIFSPDEDVNKFSLLKKGTYYFVIDIQSFEPEEEHTYSFDLKNKYSIPSDDEVYSGLIVISYFFIYLSESEDDVKDLYDKSFDWFGTKGIYVMPGINCEKQIFYSNCTFGLNEFHVFQVSSPDVIGSLLL